MTTYLKTSVGNGDKLHIGAEITLPDGRVILAVGCGSRRAGTVKRTYGVIDFQSFAQDPRSCEKCLERHASKVVAA